MLYDIQLWLYTNVYPDTTEEDYLSAYKKIIALDGEFSTGGYAPDFVTDWLTRRKESGIITCNNGIVSMTTGAKETLLADRDKMWFLIGKYKGTGAGLDEQQCLWNEQRAIICVYLL